MNDERKAKKAKAKKGKKKEKHMKQKRVKIDRRERKKMPADVLLHILQSNHEETNQ